MKIKSLNLIELRKNLKLMKNEFINLKDLKEKLKSIREKLKNTMAMTDNLNKVQKEMNSISDADINLQILYAKLKPIRDEFKINMIMTDLRKFDVLVLGNSLKLIERAHDIFTEFKIPIFIESTNLLIRMISDILAEEFNYPTIMSYALHLYEMLEDALYAFLRNEKMVPEFENKVNLFKKLYNNADADSDFKSDSYKVTNKNFIIQKKSSTDILDKNLFVEFLNECENDLKLSYNHLVELQNNLNCHQKDNIINSIFKVIHKMKRTSGFLNLYAIDSLTYLMKVLLLEIKYKKRNLTSNIIDTFLYTIDTLKQLIVYRKEIIQGKELKSIDIHKAYLLLSENLQSDEGKIL